VVKQKTKEEEEEEEGGEEEGMGQKGRGSEESKPKFSVTFTPGRTVQ